MLTRLALTLLSCYKSLISPFIPPACRFYPSCSEYSQLSIRKHGLLKGICLTVARLSKCHPLHPGGFDPVP